MNKTKMILAGTGGAIGLIVLVLGFLVWQAFSAKTAAIEGDDEEGTDGLETVEARARTLSRKPVYPSAASVSAIEANQKAVDDWCKEGLKLAACGDKVFEKTTAPKFKAFLVADAHRIAGLSGGVGGKLVKPDFAFGPFKDYIAEGKMPTEAELANLQRQWDDVATIAEMLSTNDVVELVDVQFAVAKPAADAGRETEDTRRKVGKKNKVKAKEDKDLPHEPRSFSYVFTFAARPSAFVKVLNNLVSCERFITVDSFSFTRPADVIAEALGGDEKKAAEAQGAGGRRGRRGRRGGAAEAPASKLAGTEEGAAASKNGVVTDPTLDAPLTVMLKVTVRDFRSLEEKSEEEEK